MGETHEIKQGEGGELGDAMMPLLYALGQHQALRCVQSQLRPSEGLLAFHDDIYVVTSPERTCEVHTNLRDALCYCSRIQIHAGKTQIWNRAGVVPRDLDKLLFSARSVDPHANLWFGDLSAPPEEGGIWVLGAHLGPTLTSSHICKASSIPAGFSSAAFLPCLICSQPASYSCFAIRLVQTTSSACAIRLR